MKRIALAGALACLSLPAFADCTAEFSEKVSFGGTVVFQSTSNYPDSLTRAEVDFMSAKAKNVMDVASRSQDKGGQYQVEFNQKITCDGQPVSEGGLVFPGVTAQGLNAIHRASLKLGADLVGSAEKAGKRKAWGKQ